jgi:hypothetical protein
VAAIHAIRDAMRTKRRRSTRELAEATEVVPHVLDVLDLVVNLWR